MSGWGLRCETLAPTMSGIAAAFGGTDGESRVEDDLPTTFAAGVGVSLLQKNLNLLMDYEASSEDAWDLRLGSEYILRDVGKAEVAFRAGYNDGSFTAGTGFTWPLNRVLVGLDYAVVLHENDPSEVHVVSWSFLF